MNARDLDPRIDDARRQAKGALGVLALFVLWLLTSWLGPQITPPGGWSLWAIGGALGGYAVLTLVTLIRVASVVLSALDTGELRWAVSRHVAPFWGVFAFAILSGLAVFQFGSGHAVVAGVLGLGMTFGILLFAYAWARALEISRLESARKQLETVEPYGPVTLF